MTNRRMSNCIGCLRVGARGKAVLLSLVWACVLFCSLDLVQCSDSTPIKQNQSMNSPHDGGDTQLQEGKIEQEHLTKQKIDENSKEKKELIETTSGLPEGAQFLAGETLPHPDHVCTCHPEKPLPIPNSTTSTKLLPTCTENADDSPCMGRVFYLVGIHNDRTLSDALDLFQAIRDPKNIILIHIDTKFGIEPYYNSPLHKEIEACPCGARVEVASVHDCQWGSWSMNLPTLWSMEKALKEYAGKWDVFVNLSGDTLPVYSQDRISRLFGGPLRGTNFVTSVACETGLVPTSILEFPKKWHKRNHYSHQPPDDLEYVDDDGVIHHEVKVDIYFGSQWVSLTPQFCDFIIRQLSRPDSLPSRFRDWLIDTEKLMADETFFTSMIMRFFPESIPKVTEELRLDTADPELAMYAIRYERMDEHVPTSKGYVPTEQRYEVPASTGITQPRPWGPYFLGTYDLNNIRTSGALYIRKVARAIDPNMYTILPVDRPEQIPPIDWPSEVQIGPLPDWEKKFAQLKKKAAK